MHLLVILAVLIGILNIPVALVPQTSPIWVLFHLLFTFLCSFGGFWAGISGRPEQARWWGFGYLVSTLGTVAALELGAAKSHSSSWLVPWLLMLAWSWIPPVVAGLSGWLAEPIARRRLERTVRRRKRALAKSSSG